LSRLKELDLRGTRITPAQYEGVEDLQKALPTCQIRWLSNELPR